MKEPEITEEEIEKKETTWREMHFCPVCDKPTVKYWVTKDEDGDIDWDDLEYLMEDVYFLDEDSKIITSITFGEQGQDDLDLNEISLKDMAEKFYKEYKEKYHTNSRIPYFCTKCFIKFIKKME